MTHQAYLVLPELTVDAIKTGAARARAADDPLTAALTLLITGALGYPPAEQAVRATLGQPPAWHDQPAGQPETRPAA